MLDRVKALVNDTKTRVKLAVGGATAVATPVILGVVSSAEGGTPAAVTAPSIATTIQNSSSIDFSQIFQQMADLVPVVLPVIIAGLALRKGISFLMSMVRGI